MFPLNTGDERKIGQSIKAGELARIGALRVHEYCRTAICSFGAWRSFRPIPDHEQMKFIGPASLECQACGTPGSGNSRSSWTT